MRISWEEQLGSETDHVTQGSSTRKLKPQNLWWEKPVGVAAVGEATSLTGEFIGKTHGVLEHTQTHTSRNQQRKGPICLWVVGEVIESGLRTKQVVLFPLGPLPHIQYHNAARWVPLPWQISKAPPLTMSQVHQDKNVAQMKEQIKPPEKELSGEEIAILSDAECKIRMLTEMIEYGHKIEEKVKAMQREIKKDMQGTNSEGKETRTQINGLEQKEEINIQPEQNEETRI